jgi:hypothetical protein
MTVEAQRPVDTHLSEEAVENYAVGRLPEAQLASFEEHLFLCQSCQERLDEEDEFAAAMWSSDGTAKPAPLGTTTRSFPPALASSCAGPSSSFRRGGLRFWIPQMGDPLALRKWATPPWRAAFALVFGISIGAAIVAWKLPLVQNSTGEADAVTLTTLRGGNDDGMAQARAHRPLDLSINLASDASAAANSLPETGLYRLEMVDAFGALQWTGTAQPVSGKLIARVEKRLGAGIFWIRMYAPSGKLLREFGLHVSK